MDISGQLRKAGIAAAAVAAALLVLATPASAAALSSDTAVLSTDHIGNGGLVVVRAGGFAPNSSVQLLNGQATGRFGDVFGVPLAADGNGDVVARIGQNLRHGTYRVRLNGLTPTNELRTVSGVYTVQRDNCGVNPCAQADLPHTGGTQPLLLAGGLLVIGLAGRRVLRGHGREIASAAAAVVVIGAAFTLAQTPDRADAAPALASYAGAVKSLTGAGLSGVCVHASNERAFGAARTDAAGRFTIAGLVPGSYSVDAVDCNASTMLMGKHVGTFTLGAGAAVIRNTVLARGGVLAGRVTDARTGNGAAGNCVHLAAGRAFGAKCALGSGLNGVFVSEPMPAGSYGVVFQDLTGRYAVEYLGGKVDPRQASRADVRSGRVYLAQASAQAATTVSGTIVDDATNQAPTWQICALLLSNDQETVMSAASGQDGTYTIDNVAAGTYKVKFTDCSGNADKYVTEYYQEKPSVETATPVAVTDGEAKTGINERMAKSGSTTTTTSSTTTSTTSTTSTTVPATTTTTASPGTTTTTTTAASGTPTRMAPTVPTTASGITARPGGGLTVSGDGFGPGSTVQGALFSTPISLGTKVAPTNGTVSFDVAIPKTFDLGTHEIQLQGVDAQNRTRVLSITVTVTNGLVRTGSDTNKLLPIGAVLVLVGAVGVFLGRRRMLGAHFLR